MPDNGRLLTPSIITSSSSLSLGELFREVLDVHPQVAFDLMILRPEDAALFGLKGPRITDLVAERFDEIRERLSEALLRHRQQYPGQCLRIPALATYFPDISSIDDNRRATACRAIVNCVKLCHYFRSRKDLMLDVSPCVEVVCGSRLEPEESPGATRPSWVLQYTLDAKIGQLIKSLKAVENELKDCKEPYALALELEPGHAYVLSDHTSLLRVYNEIQKDKLKHIGLNLDIAHFKIAGISARFLKGEPESGMAGKDLTHWIVHGHIADHPLRMHTRDLPLGAFTNLEYFPSDFCGYLDLLMDRSVDFKRNPDGLPFSGAVALELEGCGRMSWIHDSVAHMKRLLRAASLRRQ